MNLTVDLQVCGILFLLAVLVAAWFFGSNWKQRLGWFFAIAVAGGVGGALCAAGPLALLQPTALSAPGIAAFLTGIFLLVLTTGYLRYYRFRPLCRKWLALAVLPVLGALVWGGTLGIGVIRYHAAQKEFDRTVPPAPAAPVPNGAELYVEAGRAWRGWLDADQERWVDFPCSGFNSWKQEVTPERKQKAVDLILSPELEPVVDQYEKASGMPVVWYSGQPLEELMQPLTGLRGVSRYLCDRAWAFHYRKEYNRILPELRKILPCGGSLRNQGVLLYDLVGFAIQAIACNAAVRIGPVGPEYAADYRAVLEELRKGQLPLSNESRFGVELLGESLDRGEDPLCLYEPASRPGKILRLFWLPLVWNRSATYLNELTDIQPEFNRLIAADMLPGEVETLDTLVAVLKDSLLLCLRKQHITDGFNEIALVLKLYRSEKGNYPETLEELVPEYLKAIPVDPVTGEAFYYRRTEKGFELVRPGTDGRGFPLEPEFEVPQ